VSDDSGIPRLRVPSPWQAVMATVLGTLRAGSLDVVMPEGSDHHFAGAAPGPSARIDVRDPSVARRIVTGGSIALGESYMDGAWDTPDLDAVLDLGIANLKLGWAAGVPVVLRPAQRLWHAMRDNDPRGGSKRNISHHYDLGNDFYELWLDDTMTYSCACAGSDAEPVNAEDLESAQRRKWDRMLDLVQPGRGDHVLEIGCGWGGFAIHTAQQSGCRVTGLTLSEQQAEFARRRVSEQGLDDRVEIRLQDYRDVPGAYDAIASIEMFEAVGEKWWPAFFGRLKELLKPGRPAGLQVITIAEGSFEHYKHNPDFIQRFIFPGGMLPSPERFEAAAKRASLKVGAPRFFGRDYARTLDAWAQRFDKVEPKVRALGFDERFIRMWRYYFAYCRAGFDAGNIDVMQVRLEA